MKDVTGSGKDVPPQKKHVFIYFVQKGCSEHDADAFFQFFDQRNWRTYRGKILSNWKMAAWQWILKQIILKKEYSKSHPY